MGTGGVDPLWTQYPPWTSGNTPSSVFWKLLCAREINLAVRQGFEPDENPTSLIRPEVSLGKRAA